MTSRANVLLLVTELNVGGAERVVEQIACGLSSDRYRVSVSCLYDPGPMAESIRAAGIPVTDLGMRGKWDARVAHRLCRLLRRERVHILHAHMIHANLLGSLVGRLAGVPVVITTRHNVNIGGALRETLNRWSRGWRDAVVAISAEVRDAELRRGGEDPSRLVLITNGIRVETFASPDRARSQHLREAWDIASDRAVIGTVSRFREQKGHRYLLEAMPSILDAMPGVQALLVGDGPLYAETKRMCEAMGLADAVTFTGIRAEVPEILALLDLFVLPSLWEGLPIALLEAMAAGKAVVATRVGGVPEVVVNGVTGLLVPPRDPGALADAVVRLLRDPELRRRMGEGGQERVRERFSVERMVRQTEDLYERRLTQKAPRLARTTEE